MSATDLADCEEDYRGFLADAVPAVLSGQADALKYFAVELSHRVIAICSLLANADVASFLEGLDRSGTARLELQKRSGLGLDPGGQILTATKAVGFPAALASGNVELSAEIGRILPNRHNPEWEYEDDFLFVDVLRRVAVGIADGGTSWVAGASDAIRRWDVVLEGRKSPERDVCKALVDLDQSAFAAAFPRAIDYRLEQFASYKKQPNFNAKLFSAEGHVWIEGLALLELATLLGLKADGTYPLVPSIARSQRSQRRGPSPDWLKV